MIRQTMWYYVAFRSLTTFGMALHFAVYTIFLMSHGLDLFKVNLVNVVFYVTLFVFEIPTGAFADVFGRKASYVVSCVLNACAAFVYATSNSFWGFALAEAVLAVGQTFASGAFEAWAVDRLKHHGYEGSLRTLFVREQFATQGVSIVAGMLGAFLSQRYLALPWWIGGGVLSLGALLAFLLLEEEYFTPKPFSFRQGWRELKKTVQNSVEFGTRHPVTRFVLIVVGVQSVGLMAPNMQWQPFWQPHLSGRQEFGYLWALIMLSVMLGGVLVKLFLRIARSEQRALLLAQSGIGLTVAATAVAGWLPLALAAFLISNVFRGLFNPLKSMYLNDNIPSGERATIISFESIAHHIGGALGLLVSGWAASRYGIPATWVGAGAALTFGSWLVTRKSHKL